MVAYDEVGAIVDSEVADDLGVVGGDAVTGAAGGQDVLLAPVELHHHDVGGGSRQGDLALELDRVDVGADAVEAEESEAHAFDGQVSDQSQAGRLDAMVGQ